MGGDQREKGDPGGEYELNPHRAHLSAYVLIAGLIIELVNAIIWYRGSETLAEIAAVALRKRRREMAIDVVA
jgi:hypothetical protein